MKNHKQINGTIQLNDKGFVIVKVGETEYQISNWYGTKNHFKISNKDLPLKCKGIINKFTGKLFNTKYKARNFEIKALFYSKF